MSETLGNLIRRGRIERGYTQTRLAQLMDVSKSAINGWETGVRRPLPSHLPGLRKNLKLDVKKAASFLMEDRKWTSPGSSIR